MITYWKLQSFWEFLTLGVKLIRQKSLKIFQIYKKYFALSKTYLELNLEMDEFGTRS